MKNENHKNDFCDFCESHKNDFCEYHKNENHKINITKMNITKSQIENVIFKSICEITIFLISEYKLIQMV